MKGHRMQHTGAVPEAYEAPVLTVLGSVADLTLFCDKTWGSSDGFTFQGSAIACASA
jgi:hypothetical protein